MRGTRMIIVAAAAISAGGCSVNVPENAFLYPDTRIAAERIELTPGPAIVLEAGRDTVLPPILSRRLAQALTAKGRSVDHLVFAEAGHNNVHSQPDFTSRMAEALARP